MFINKILLIATSAFLIVACGGGGGSTEAPASEIETNSGSSESTEETTTENNPETTTMLVTGEEFLLETNADISINIVIRELFGQRAYVNICHTDTEGNIDYTDCIVKTPLTNGEYMSVITIGNEVEELAMQVWRYSLTEEPINSLWRRSNGLLWDINL